MKRYLFLSLFALLVACAPPNTAPTISSLNDQQVLQNTLPAASETISLPFNIADAEDEATQLEVSTSVSDQNAIPKVSSSCIASECQLELVVNRNDAKTVTITVTVRDTRMATASSSFTVNIGPKQLTTNSQAELKTLLEQASAGDVIGFDSEGVFKTPQVLELSSELVIDKELTLQGPGPSLLSLSGIKTTRLFRIVPGTTFTLQNLSLIDGQAQDDAMTDYGFPLGGSIFNEGALSLAKVIFLRNTATNGGAIYNYGTSAELSLDTCVFGSNTVNDANTVSLSGGAIFNNQGKTTIKNSTFSHNKALERGAAIYNLGQTATLEISGSTFSNNVARDGGAIKNDQGKVQLKDSILGSNTATEVEGGALFNTNGQITISGSTFSNNRSLIGAGGAIYSFGPEATLLIDKSEFTGNFSHLYGGAIVHEKGSKSLTVQNASIFKTNQTDGDGGAIYTGSSLSLSADSLITENIADADGDKAGQGGGIYNEGGSLTGVSSTNVTGNQPDDLAGMPLP